tara:strand:+ start:163 stop:486 length:324 start_codon:yes stop_codon:yes gene_type:complete
MLIKKDFLVTRIDASVDGGPYVMLHLSDPRDFREGKQQQPFSANVMGFSSMEDLFKGLNKTLGNLPKQITGGGSTTIKVDMREYEDSNLKVGDKVAIQISREEKEGL